jgi:cyclophilin family peptidyl-prolyl cis-trans isomerase/HEAT repeat protein
MRWSALALVVLAACSGSRAPLMVAPVAGDVPDLEERALLLLLVDQQLYDPFTVRRAKALGPELRVELARTLARAGDPRGRLDLEDLVVDDDLAVRREAIFGLGVLGDPQAIPVLSHLARGADTEAGRLAIEALAKLGAPIEEVVKALAGLPPADRWGRLAPSLYRFPPEAALPTVRRALIEGGEAVFPQAVYALARKPQTSSAPLLRELLADPEPALRAQAARALGVVGDGSDVARLLPLLDDADPAPVIQALQAARRLVAAGEAAPPAEWSERLLALFDDPRVGVRFTAIEAAGAWLRDVRLGTALEQRFATATGRERELALLALAASRQPRAGLRVGEASGADDPSLRQRAAAAAGLLADTTVLERLAADASPLVRAAAVGQLLRLSDDPQAVWEGRALDDPDAVVRATALDWAVEHPVVTAPEILAALGGMGKTDAIEAQFSALDALRARAAAEPAERELAIAALTLLAKEADFVLRDRAGQALEALGTERPPLGPVRSQRTVAVYRDLVRRSWEPRAVRVTTPRGAIDVLLECRQAPLTCVNFLQLAAQGFYDGLTFQRVVPGFVIQGGDPRNDGFGGPGYTIRDEINRLRYDRGRVGMALAGKHTGGSQFFITLAPQPHLDGDYTIFGRVVAGDDVLDAIEQGDAILGIDEIPAAP